jgi:alpha-L-fucosidase 2
MIEMLMQSHAGEIELLPALPSAWPTGTVTGLRARGGIDVSLSWRERHRVEATLIPRLGNPLTVRYGDQVRHFPTSHGQPVSVRF